MFEITGMVEGLKAAKRIKSDWAVAIGLINQVFAEEGRAIAAEGGDSLVQSRWGRQ